MGTTNSPNMLLPVPQVGAENGPQYATDINSCLALVDQHDHSPQHGVQITPTGLNINADLAFNSNNLTLARSIRFTAQSSPISNPSDLDCVYVSGVDLYYNDGNGNQVRITQSGGVAGTPGSISNLNSPASASYVGANQTFVWQSAANTPANLDAGSVILRNIVANSKGLTLSPPNAMGSDYSITLPALPGSNLPVSISNAGIMSAAAISNSQLDSNLQRRVNNTPTVTVIQASGTYTPPANCTYLEIEMVGGGGGGGGGSSVNGGFGNTGTNGANTSFDIYLVAGGGSGGVGGRGGGTLGGSGGSSTVSAPALGAGWQGGSGDDGTGLGIAGVGGGTGRGGRGAGTCFADGGGGGLGAGEASGTVSPFIGAPGGATSVGHDAPAFSGAGGGGGGVSASSVNATSGGGGGAGGYIKAIFPNPSGPYTVTIGTGGAGGSGFGGTDGGAGANGCIIIKEHYGA